MTDLVLAQHFKIADKIIVLGDHGIKEQGSWVTIQAKADSIGKFTSNLQSKNDVALSASFDRLGAQFRTTDEAKADLTRQTGDFAIYSTVPVQT